MQKNENRTRHKKTKAGWIPEDWSVVALGKCARFLDSQRVPLKGKDRKKRHGIYPYYGASGVIDHIDDYLFDDELILLGEDGANILQRATRLAFRVKGKIWVNNHAHVIKPESQTNIGFLCEYLESISYTKYNTGTTQPKLNREVCTSIPIPLPPLPEQEAIASVLECWDKAIWNYEKKIEKKRNIKKGLMQRLLSGKQRLPGFSGEWKNYRFGDVFSFLKTYAFSRKQLTTDQLVDREIYNIHYGDLHATYGGCILDCDKELRIPRLRKGSDLPYGATMLKEGDLVIADASEDYEGVCACVELRNIGSKAITGGLHTFVARDVAGKTAHGYRGFILKEHNVSKKLKRIATGVSIHGVSKTNLTKIEIALPCLQEQQAIAAVLSKADEEIGALERKLSALKDQKRFLLNNLVTGTIRLPQFVGARKTAANDGDDE